MKVVFIDTSILCAILRVPGKCTGRAEIMAEYDEREREGHSFVLPVTTVIETGNHIEQLPEGCGDDRRRCAQGLAKILRSIAKEDKPWVLHGIAWNDELLTRFCDGGPQSPPFVEVATTGQLGGGDLSILVERDYFKEKRANVPVEVWTLDKELGAWT